MRTRIPEIRRNTLRHDGTTVGEAMDRDAAFLRSIGIPAQDGQPTFYERREQCIDEIRRAVLDALDEQLGGRGWIDGDLPELFKALDAHIGQWERRNGVLGFEALSKPSHT